LPSFAVQAPVVAAAATAPTATDSDLEDMEAEPSKEELDYAGETVDAGMSSWDESFAGDEKETQAVETHVKRPRLIKKTPVHSCSPPPACKPEGINIENEE